MTKDAFQRGARSSCGAREAARAGAAGGETKQRGSMAAMDDMGGTSSAAAYAPRRRLGKVKLA